MWEDENKKYDEEAKIEALKETIKKIYPDSCFVKSDNDCEIDYCEML